LELGQQSALGVSVDISITVIMAKKSEFEGKLIDMVQQQPLLWDSRE
jgi:hypothetical protein